jgi:hypothetical protein
MEQAMSVPTYLAFIVLGADIAIIVAILFGLRKSLAAADWPEALRFRTNATLAAVLTAWFALAVALGWFDFFRGASGRLPTIQFGVFLPIVVGVALWLVPIVRRTIEAVPQSWIVGVQLYRVLGVIFLVLYASGKIPGAFALPAGIGDVLTGLLAPIVALGYARGRSAAERRVLAWNVFGLLDLVVAVTTGFLTSPSPFQLLSLDAPNQLISAFPLVMVPAFAVPLSVLLHLASLAKLRATSSRGALPSGVRARSA